MRFTWKHCIKMAIQSSILFILFCLQPGLVNSQITFSNLPSSVNIPEGVTSSATIFTATAIDQAGGAVTYSCDVIPNDGKFVGSCGGGAISHVGNPGFSISSTSVYVVIVKAGSAEANLTVNIVSPSGPPNITNLPFTMNFAEGQLIGSFIYQVTASKPAAAAGVVFSLEQVYTSSSSASFSITSDGKLKVGSLLDADASPNTEYIVEIKACDTFPVPLCDQGNLTLQITEGNDPPVFTPDTVDIVLAESTTNGTVVETVWTIADEDGDFVFIYNIESSNYTYLTIDQNTGMVTVNEPLDYETFPQDEVTIVVSATDPRGLVGYLSLNLSLTDVNDCPATFYPATCAGNVTENDPAGTKLLTLNATDCDVTPAYQQFSYIVEPPYDATYIITEESDGTATLSLKKPINREDVGNLLGLTELTVSTRDVGGLTSSIFCIITVGDVNEFDPVFEQSIYRYFVRYDADVGTVVDQLEAVDNDTTGKPLEYSVSNLTSVPELYVGFYGGHIIVEGALESNRLYSMYVQATDRGTPPRSSKQVQVMVETFDPVLYLTDWAVDTGGAHLTPALQKTLEQNIAATCQPCSARITEVYQSEIVSNHYVVSMYFIDGDTNTTSDLRLKTVEEILAQYTTGDGLTPTTSAAGLGPGSYPVVRIQDKYTINWWLETPEGIATTALLCLLALAGLVALTSFVVYKSWWLQRPEKREYLKADDVKAPVMEDKKPIKTVAFNV